MKTKFKNLIILANSILFFGFILIFIFDRRYNTAYFTDMLGGVSIFLIYGLIIFLNFKKQNFFKSILSFVSSFVLIILFRELFFELFYCIQNFCGDGYAPTVVSFFGVTFLFIGISSNLIFSLLNILNRLFKRINL